MQGPSQDFSKRITICRPGGGSILGLQTKKGGPGGGPTLGPVLNSLHSGPKRRGFRTPAPPLDPPMICRPIQNNYKIRHPAIS